MIAPVVDVLQKNQQSFHSVVDFDPAKDRLTALDFTAQQEGLTPEILGDTDQFTSYINEQLQEKNALYGIGGYGEHRTVYARSKVFDGIGTEEPRRLHLGTDIWGRPYTHITAPLDGIVHSFGFNNDFGDYGATIILSHFLDGHTFHTLYGHLSLNDLKNLEEGQTISRGEVFAEFGLPFENGHWPPHLHFQVIIDLQGWNGDYPGVCRFSEKDQYMQNCPDPDLILQLNQYL